MSKGRPPRSGHGTYGYGHYHRCTCEPCMTAIHRYSKALRLDHERGIRRRVDATAARENVHMLFEAGATCGQIAMAAGVSESQVRNLVRGNLRTGEVTYMLPPAAEALSRVTFAACMEHPGQTNTVGSRRRVHALMYMGHPPTLISANAGISNSTIYYWFANPEHQMLHSTAKLISEQYEALSMTHGTNTRVRWKAYREGYLPPMAWDEATIDDPDAEPDLSAVVCVAGRCTRRVERNSLCAGHWREANRLGAFKEGRYYKLVVERLGKTSTDHQGLMENLAALKELGYTPEAAAKRLGRGVAYVEKIWSVA